MKKTLLTLTMIGLLTAGTLAMSSCGGKEAASTPPVSVALIDATASITNKDAMSAEWHYGEENRQLRVEFTGATVNLANALKQGTVTITSSNEDVATVIGSYISTSGVGSATITITTAKGTDTVAVTVADRIAAPAIIQRTAKDALAQKEIYTSEYTYLISGKVKSVDATTKAVTIDDNGTEIEAYIASDYSKLTWSTTSHGFVLADTNYGADFEAGKDISILAIRNEGKFYGFVGAYDGGTTKPIVQTPTQVLSYSNPGAFYLFSVTGVVTEIVMDKTNTTVPNKYGNIYLRDVGGAAVSGTTHAAGDLYVYGCTATAVQGTGDKAKNTLSFSKTAGWSFSNPADFATNTVTKEIKIGSTVTVVGFRCDYTGKNGVTIEINGVVTSVTAPASAA